MPSDYRFSLTAALSEDILNILFLDLLFLQTTPSPLRSLEPCWIAFLNILQMLVAAAWRPFWTTCWIQKAIHRPALSL